VELNCLFSEVCCWFGWRFRLCFGCVLRTFNVVKNAVSMLLKVTFNVVESDVCRWLWFIVCVRVFNFQKKKGTIGLYLLLPRRLCVRVDG